MIHAALLRPLAHACPSSTVPTCSLLADFGEDGLFVFEAFQGHFWGESDSNFYSSLVEKAVTWDRILLNAP